MTLGKYPTQLDCVWLASAANGEVAALITAGEGPIPFALLARCDVSSIEREILQSLPESTVATILITVPKPQGYLRLAERGLHVYDWMDLHRAKLDETGVYELVGRPQRPLHVNSLPDDLRSLVVTLPIGSFAQSLKVEGVTSGADGA